MDAGRRTRRGRLWDALRDAPRRAPGLAGGVDCSVARCSPAWITRRRTRCWPRRWGRSARGRGCWRGWGRKRPSRSTNCSPQRSPTARRTRPSLQGFRAVAAAIGAEVKREAEEAGGDVRIMTVHGAKGLQAPLVILPDTTTLPPDDDTVLWAADDASGVEVPVWAPRKALRCVARSVTRGSRAAAGRGTQPPALCGADPCRGPAAGVRLAAAPRPAAGMLVLAGPRRLAGARRRDSAVGPEPWEGERLVHGAPQTRDPEQRRGHEADAPPSPCRPGPAPRRNGRHVRRRPSRRCRRRWRPAGRRTRCSARCRKPPRRSPSATPGARGSCADRSCTRCCNTCRHCRKSARHGAARPICPGHGLDGAAADVAGEVMAVLAHPELAPLFGPAGRPRCR